MEYSQIIKDITDRGDPEELRSLFAFDKSNTNEQIKFKFNIWSRYFFLKYFTSADCPDHAEMDMNNIMAYRAQTLQYVNVAFRGFAKTARTKLFIAFCIANDRDHFKRYIRCLSADLDNAKQSVTDIFNMFIQPKMKLVYPAVFQKTEGKRDETMSSFTTSTGIKVLAKQISVDQRGKIMEDAKSDFDWYDDIETKTTIMSAPITHKIGVNMEEARTGLATHGSSIYTVNYFSEAGNVHKLVKKKVPGKVVQITPIIKNIKKKILEHDQKEHVIGGDIVWDRYSLEDIDQMFQADDDFAGERLCKPSASKDVYFDREKVERQEAIEPIREISYFKMFADYNAAHRYGLGADVAGGVGLDSSATVIIDFDTIPAQVVGTYNSNTILPEAFGDEVYSEGNRFGGCLLAIENNKYDQAVLKAKLLGGNVFMTPAKSLKAGYQEPTTYGWNTNGLTKGTMLSSLREAVESGLISLNDDDLIEEIRGYTRNDLISNAPDVRMTTRHFDLLIACAIAWQMRNHARPKKVPQRNYASSQQETNPAI